MVNSLNSLNKMLLRKNKRSDYIQIFYKKIYFLTRNRHLLYYFFFNCNNL